jgi:imidazolonepropionase-like amidohydrolase
VPQYTTLYTAAYRKNLAGFANMVSRKIELVREGLGNAGQTINALNDAGATIVAGTDSPIFPYGLSLIIELQNYVDAGLSPAAALRTATINAADAMGAGEQVGRIQSGMLADMVIVNGDPLNDISDLLYVQGVMLNGRYHTLAELLE